MRKSQSYLWVGKTYVYHQHHHLELHVYMLEKLFNGVQRWLFFFAYFSWGNAGCKGELSKRLQERAGVGREDEKAAKGRRRHYTVVVPVQHMITLADCSVCSQKATGPCESYFLPIQYKTEIPNEYLHLLTHYWKTAFLVLQAQYWSLRSTTLGHTPYPALCSSPHDSKHNAHNLRQRSSAPRLLCLLCNSPQQ